MWQICPGTWLQLSTGHDRPGANNARVRFEVGDVLELGALGERYDTVLDSGCFHVLDD